MQQTDSAPSRPTRLASVAAAPAVDVRAAQELRTTITAARGHLRDVLHARARTLASLTSWVGPHRDQYDRDALELLEAGRSLDTVLARLLMALDAEIDAEHGA